MPRLRRETGPLGAGREFLEGPWTLAASRVLMSPHKEMFQMCALPGAGGLSFQQLLVCGSGDEPQGLPLSNVGPCDTKSLGNMMACGPRFLA